MAGVLGLHAIDRLSLHANGPTGHGVILALSGLRPAAGAVIDSTSPVVLSNVSQELWIVAVHFGEGL